MAASGADPHDRPQFPAIPYGLAYFKGIRREGCLYVDKTRFLHALEQERFVFFIRPRRFGKTCWLSMMESYYDRNQADDFAELFGGTDVVRDPTPNRGRYVVLRFNFSAFNDALETLERKVRGVLRTCSSCGMRWKRNPESVLRSLALRAHPARRRASTDALNALFLHAGRHDIPLYVLIDEYDNFANTILARQGADAYHDLTHGGGFFRNFFATLKAGTENGSVERLFVTGVSPVTMDDVTSGFNIGSNLSLQPEFNEMLGFTEDEVRGMVDTYRNLGVFDQDVAAALDTMREWYDGYRFAQAAESVVYNTDMVLYYLKHSLPNKTGPGQPDRRQRPHRLRQAAPPVAHRAPVERQLRSAAPRDRRRTGGQRDRGRASRRRGSTNARTSCR